MKPRLFRNYGGKWLCFAPREPGSIKYEVCGAGENPQEAYQSWLQRKQQIESKALKQENTHAA